MLNKKEQQKLSAYLAKQKAKAVMLPEEEELIRKAWPASGLHRHDEDNPFGVHRHFLDEEIDGAHIHTMQNPGGEHVHGLKEGQALIDGAHTHSHDGLGWHNHEHNDKDNFGNIPIQKPALNLEPANPDTPERED